METRRLEGSVQFPMRGEMTPETDRVRGTERVIWDEVGLTGLGNLWGYKGRDESRDSPGRMGLMR